ncbi:MAG: hypothetical protein ABIK28_03450, partial [Planctomycetota bacterium]
MTKKILILSVLLTALFATLPLWAADPDEAKRIPLQGENASIALPLDKDNSILLTRLLEFMSKT